MVAAEPRGRARACPRPADRRTSAFTLIELLVVMGIIVLFVSGIGLALRGSGSSTVGLQASQSMLVALLTEARSQAVLAGRDAAILVHNDTTNLPERYLRYLVPVIRDTSDTTWVAMSAGFVLPQDCVVVPNPALSGNWVENGTTWAGLRSSALSGAGSALPIESTTPQQWLILRYTPRGTTSAGNLVVANSIPLGPGSATPFRIINPRNVRGVAVTAYGQTRLINDSTGF